MSRKLSSLFISHEIIPAEDKEVYEYSFEVLLSMLVSFVVLFSIAILTGTVTNTMVYLTGFIPLRLVAGGYHAKTHFRCLVILMCAYATFLLLQHMLLAEFLIYGIVLSTIVSVILVFFFAPADDSNKPMTEAEKIFSKKKSRILIVCCAVAVFLLITFIVDLRVAFSFALGNLTVAISLPANMVKYKIMEVKNQTTFEGGNTT